MSKNKFSTRDLCIIALFTALTAVMSQISIPLPFGPIPFTLQTFAIYLCAIILGSRLGTISQIIYVLLGAIGIPVFASFSGGLQCILGPTGGFIIAFPIVTFIVGKITSKNKSTILTFTELIFTLIFLYAMGITQLCFITKMPLLKAIMVGAVPFIPLDIVKIIIAYIIGVKIKISLLTSNLLKKC